MFPSALFHTLTPTVLFGSSSPSSPSTSSASYASKANCNIRLSMASSVRIVIVGDVHDDWNLEEDSKALELLRPDLVLFTGDFGNENVKLVRSIAALKMAKAAILGNHDAWNTQNFSEKQLQAVNLICLLAAFITRCKLSNINNINFPTRDEILGRRNVQEEMLYHFLNSGKCREVIRMSEITFKALCKSWSVTVEHAARFLHIVGNDFENSLCLLYISLLLDNERKDAVQLQLESFGEEHVGYKRLDFHSLKLSVIGGRPFSCGGERFFRKQLLSKRYGVHNMSESATKICEAAVGTPKDHSIILLAHNGPTGLGSNMNDICGRDWVRGGGDHGDPDLAVAISQLKGTTKYSIPLVVFGHMHKELAFGNGPRKMIVIGDDNTIYLNGAIVPRVKRFPHTNTPNSNPTLRAFTLIDSKHGNLTKITETWVLVSETNTNIEEELVLYSNNNTPTTSCL